jgi:hypothetical protein
MSQMTLAALDAALAGAFVGAASVTVADTVPLIEFCGTGTALACTGCGAALLSKLI